jgi:hypothetical protein
MFVVLEPHGIRRELLLHVPATARAAVGLDCNAVVAAVRSELELEPLPLLGGTSPDDVAAAASSSPSSSSSSSSLSSDFALFRQCNARLSRKQVQPAMERALGRLAAGGQLLAAV